MATYAGRTEVPADRSRNEIERTLTRYGATKFMYGWQEEAAVIAFELSGRQIKFLLPLPRKDDPQFAHTPGRRRLRAPEQRLQAWEQATRQRWRALALIIKAKLEAVESGIVSLEDEFLAQTLLPDGRTVGQWLQPQLKQAYETQRMPSMLPLPAGPREG